MRTKNLSYNFLLYALQAGNGYRRVHRPTYNVTNKTKNDRSRRRISSLLVLQHCQSPYWRIKLWNCTYALLVRNRICTLPQRATQSTESPQLSSNRLTLLVTTKSMSKFRPSSDFSSASQPRLRLWKKSTSGWSVFSSLFFLFKMIHLDWIEKNSFVEKATK